MYIGDASLTISTLGKRKFCMTTVGIKQAEISAISLEGLQFQMSSGRLLDTRLERRRM